MLDSIVVKVTSTSAFFGEPSVIRVILEKMIPGALGLVQSREVMFIHRKVEEQPTAIAVEIHEAGSESARALIEGTLSRFLDSPKLTFAVRFTSAAEDTGTSIQHLVAVMEALKALDLHFDAIVASSNISEDVDPDQDVERYLRALLADFLLGDTDFDSMSEQELDQKRAAVDQMMAVTRSVNGWD